MCPMTAGLQTCSGTSSPVRRDRAGIDSIRRHPPRAGSAGKDLLPDEWRERREIGGVIPMPESSDLSLMTDRVGKGWFSMLCHGSELIGSGISGQSHSEARLDFGFYALLTAGTPQSLDAPQPAGLTFRAGLKLGLIPPSSGSMRTLGLRATPEAVRLPRDLGLANPNRSHSR